MSVTMKSATMKTVDETEMGHPLVARASNPAGTVVRVGAHGVAVDIGAREFVVAAGPCSVETRAQVADAATGVAAAGARLLRGGAFKPRTSPYAFQGLGIDGLVLLAEAGAAAGLPTVTEVVAAEDVAVVAHYADALQVGARNTQNFALLKALGQAGKPVLLKRGMSTTVEELLMAAEYVIAHGNPDVILCERGIRTFETTTRNTLDLNAVAVLKLLTHLPVLVDPSHGTGRRELVAPLAKAAAAVGADGLIIEVHPRPAEAWSDGPQSLTPEDFADLMRELVGHVAVEGRTLAVPRVTRTPTVVARVPEPISAVVAAYRERIDQLDDALLQIIEERAAIASKLGRIKSATGQPISVPQREAAVVARAGDNARGALAPAAARRVFQTIVEETRAIQLADQAAPSGSRVTRSAHLTAVES